MLQLTIITSSHWFSFVLHQTTLWLLVATLFGCGFVPRKDQGNMIKPEQVEDLRKGMDTSQVRQLFGPPLAQNPFRDSPWVYVFSSNAKSIDQSMIKQLEVHFDADGYTESWHIKSGPKPHYESVDLND